LTFIDLAFEDPVAQEGIGRHHGGQENGPGQVMPDFGIDVVAGQGQLAEGYPDAQGLPGNEITGQAGYQEPRSKQTDDNHYKFIFLMASKHCFSFN